MPASTIQSFIDSIAAKTNIDPRRQKRLWVQSYQLFNRKPTPRRWASYLPKYRVPLISPNSITVVVGSGGGLLGTLSGVAASVLGKGCGTPNGPDWPDRVYRPDRAANKMLANALLTYIKGVADPALVTRSLIQWPGLKQHFAH